MLSPGRRIRNVRARGTAMVEFCLTAPLLAAVLILIFFCGWSFSRLQRVGAAARFGSDARAEGLDEDAETIEETFFDEMGIESLNTSTGGAEGVVTDFVDEAGLHSPWAAAILEDQWSHGRRGGFRFRVTGDFPTDLRTYEQLGTQLSRMAGRTDHPWQYRRLQLSRSLERTFLTEWVDLLEMMPSPADHLAMDFYWAWRSGW